ncbi:MAG: VCBS repeat-containing protein [Deltaproteobacteria bacterium]|nr:MAG: VCBS repeat-containing protein [Deltaproteobacteria bacterium]
MKDMESISLIFKILAFIFLIFHFGCSSPQERVVPEIKEPPKINFGPTSSENTIFKDQTKEYGLEGVTGSHFYAVDFNSDSFTDLVVLPDLYSTPRFYQFNSQTKKFILLGFSPFKTLFPASFLNFADLDRDGILDVLVGTFNQQKSITPMPLRLFKGVLKKGRLAYQEVKGAFGKISAWPTSSAVFLDFDLDGYLDLYVGNWLGYLGKDKLPVPDKLFKGEGLKFRDISRVLRGENEFIRSSGTYFNARPTIGVSTCDVDKNGYPDILTSSSLRKKNKLWLNLSESKTGKRVFIDYGVESGFAKLTGGNSFYSLCGDFDGDQVFDILTGEFNYSHDFEVNDRSALLKGLSHSFPPKFKRESHHLDVGRWAKGRSDRRGHFFDFNNDSLSDLLIDDSGFPPDSRQYLLKQGKMKKFKNVSKISGLDFVNPSGTVLVDLNRDGKMDVITGQIKIRDRRIKPRVYLFLNRSQNKNRSINVFLRGKKSNIRGIGSLVTLKTNQGKQMRWVQRSFGTTPSQNGEGTHFGIAYGDKPLQLTIKWPYKDLFKKYSLERFKFKRNLDLTFCESGKIIVGRAKSCP